MKMGENSCREFTKMTTAKCDVSEFNVDVISDFINNDINKTVAPDTAERQTTKTKVNEKLSLIFEVMREKDGLFEMMTPGKERHLKQAGSVNRGLKVVKPDEFDFNIVLHLPITKDNRDKDDIQVERSASNSGFFTMSFPESSWKWPTRRREQRKAWRIVKPYQSVKGEKRLYLRADGLRQWMQGLMSRVIREPRIKEENKIQQSRSGPAVTIKVEVENHKGKTERVSIDLVPVVGNIPEQAIPEVSTKDFEDKKDKNFHLVPALPKFASTEKDRTVAPEIFRGTFPRFENELVDKKKHLKTLIRYLKVRYLLHSPFYV